MNLYIVSHVSYFPRLDVGESADKFLTAAEEVKAHSQHIDLDGMSWAEPSITTMPHRAHIHATLNNYYPSSSTMGDSSMDFHGAGSQRHSTLGYTSPQEISDNRMRPQTVTVGQAHNLNYRHHVQTSTHFGSMGHQAAFYPPPTSPSQLSAISSPSTLGSPADVASYPTPSYPSSWGSQIAMCNQPEPFSTSMSIGEPSLSNNIFRHSNYSAGQPPMNRNRVLKKSHRPVAIAPRGGRISRNRPIRKAAKAPADRRLPNWRLSTVETKAPVPETPVVAKEDVKIQEGTSGVFHLTMSENELTAIRPGYPTVGKGRLQIFVNHDEEGKDKKWRVRVDPEEYIALQNHRFAVDGTVYVKRKWTKKMDQATALKVGSAYGERRKKNEEAYAAKEQR